MGVAYRSCVCRSVSNVDEGKGREKPSSTTFHAHAAYLPVTVVVQYVPAMLSRRRLGPKAVSQMSQFYCTGYIDVSH